MAEPFVITCDGLQLSEDEAGQLIMLRMRSPSEEAIAGVGALIGVDLPLKPNHTNGSQPRVIWMGPDEWMLIEPGVSESELEAVRGTATTLAVSVADGRYALDVTGPLARDFLAKACPVDLRASAFPVDRSAMTLFAQVPVIIDYHASDAFRLWFDVSLRDYVRQWCAEASREFAV